MDTNAEKLIYALYAEINAKKPHLSAAAQNIGLAGEVLGRAVNSLYAAGLISGVSVKFGDEDETPFAFEPEHITLTRRGTAYVESALDLKGSASSIQKLNKVIAKAAAPGWEGVKAVAEKALKEHMETG